MVVYKRSQKYKKYATLRDERGLTDYQVAKASGVAFQTLQSWKNGEYCPKIDKLLRIAAFFEVPIDFFMEV